MNTISVKITFNHEEAAQFFTNLEKEQFPFAHAKALTRLAQGAQEKVQKITKEKFELKTDFIPKGIAIRPAKKSDVKMRKASSAVYTKERVGEFMPKHETGDTRRPEGKSLAIPGKGVDGTQYMTSKLARKRFETSTGKIRKGQTPKAFMDKNRAGVKKAPFIITSKQSGLPMMVKRKGKGAYPLEVLYVFRSEAKYDKVWGFAETVESYVNEKYEIVFREELARAVATAR